MYVLIIIYAFIEHTGSVPKRCVKNVKTKRRVAQVSALVSEPEGGEVADNESDTNADTCCLGKNFKVIQFTRRVADVYAYDQSIAPIENVPIVSGATAWDDPATGVTYLLIFHEALYYGTKLSHSLINPNQVRAHGIDFWDNPFDKSKEICIEMDDIQIELNMRGTKVLFESRAPTDEEIASCPRIEMTSKSEWNPESVILSNVSSDVRRDICQRRIAQTHVYKQKTFEYVDPSSDEAILHDIAPSFIDLKEQLISTLPRNVAQVNRFDTSLEDLPVRQTFTSTDRHGIVSAEVLADRFGIGLNRARDTLKATHQRGVRSALLPISRRYRADRQFDTKRLKGKFATDTVYAKRRSLVGNIGSQVYSHKCGFNECYHLPKVDGERVGNSLKSFISDYGAPDHLTFDGAAVQVGRNTDFQKTIRKYEIKSHVSAPRRPDENPAEGAIREIKRRWYRLQAKSNIPDRLWDFGIKYVCETGNVTANSSKYSGARTPIEIITGDTPDISEYMDFGLYDWVVYRSNAGMGLPEIGRWLGVSHRVGKLMSYWIFPSSGIPISATSVQRITNLERQTMEYKKKMSEYDDMVKSRWSSSNIDLADTLNDGPRENVLSLEDESDEFKEEFRRVIDNEDVKDAEDLTMNEIGERDPYIGMKLGLRHADEELTHARVKRRKLDAEGRPVGTSHNNPLMDQRQYEVEYIDGKIEVLTANVIAENLLAQVDDEGHRHLLIDEIEGFRKNDDAIPKEEGTYSASGVERKKRTTKGWQFYVRWKDGSADWVGMKDLKDSYPVSLADYAISNDLQDEPAFAWWVPYVLRKRTAIIKKIKSKYWQRTHKYGVRVPKSIREAKEIDAENGDTRWMDSVRLEMKNSRVAFQTYDGDPKSLVSYMEITGYIVFDVKQSKT